MGVDEGVGVALSAGIRPGGRYWYSIGIVVGTGIGIGPGLRDASWCDIVELCDVVIRLSWSQKPGCPLFVNSLHEAMMRPCK